jgi:hypothetical protein
VKKFVPIAGTWGAMDDGDPNRLWWFGSHPWQTFMRENGLEAINPDDPFYWSTDLSRRAWIAGGLSLIWYLLANVERFEGEPLRIITHSFGINVVAYAAYFGLDIDTVITAGPPHRMDMMKEFDALRAHTKRWLTIFAEEPDRMVIAGELADGLFSTEYPPKFESDYQDTVPGISHSKIFYDVDSFHWWRDNGWLELLASEDWGRRSLQSEMPASITQSPPMNLYRTFADRFNARLIK